LVVFTTVQNLAEIDAAVLIICLFFDFTSLAGERLFMPQKVGVWGDLTPYMGRHINETPQRYILWEKDVI